MASLGVLVFSLLFCLPNTAISDQDCFDSFCNMTGPAIRFPFAVKYNQLYGCGYRGFDLSCNDRKQTILNLPSSEDFSVQSIDYKANKIIINDPKACLPKRFLATLFTISGTPFFLGPYNRIREYTFLNCSGTTLLNFMQVPCLSGDTYSVVAALSEVVANKTFWSCDKLSSVLVPQGLDDSWDISDDIQLKWRIPGCVSCEEKGGVCGLKSDTTGLVFGCSNLTSHGGHGLPRSAKYGLIIGIGIPGVLCIIGFTCFISRTARSYDRAPRPQGTTVNLGIDGSIIESYPKMVLGESRRLLNPNDGTCSICLSEYQPKETLRIIPECNHYFHVQCIDEWLKKNATCPLCRNLPEEASLTIHST